VTIQLRNLQTLTGIGAEQNTTIIFPMPIDLIAAFVDQSTNGRVPTVASPPLVISTPVDQ